MTLINRKLKWKSLIYSFSLSVSPHLTFEAVLLPTGISIWLRVTILSPAQSAVY